MITGDASLSVRSHIGRQRRQPHYVKLADKALFCVGVAYCPFMQWVMLTHSDYFALCYATSIILLLSWRAWSFSRRKLHYFLLDFCYYVNALCLLYLWLSAAGPAPRLFRVVFALSNGPLLVAVAVWRNALVFHSIDKVTTTLVHALPPCLMYCLRWLPTEDSSLPISTHRADDARGAMAPSDVWVNALGAYVLWQLGYLLLTEVLVADRLAADAELLTSLKWLARDSRGFMNRLCHVVNERLGLMAPDDAFDEKTWHTKITFWSAQFLYTLLTLLLAPLMFDLHWIHAATLVCFLMSTVWQAASYYIEVFSQRYAQQFAGVAVVDELKET